MRNALRTMPKELRDRIYVIAVAPGAYIDAELCGGIVHLVSQRDIVPWSDFAGRLRCRDTIEYLSPDQDAPLFDHGFDSPTYTKPLEKHITRFMKGW